MTVFSLGVDTLSSHLLVSMSQKRPSIKIEPKAFDRLESYRRLVDKAAQGDASVYGINTGFGFLSDVKISKEDLAKLQVNLIASHACGMGSYLQPQEVRALLILRAHTFLLGHSGVSRECLMQIMSYLHHDILPCIPEKGSVGASGDLAPLAHLALGLIGEGDSYYEGKVEPTQDILSRLQIKPYSPKAKEGLSLINGTQFMATLGAFAVTEAKRLMVAADVIAALSLDAIRGSLRPFDSRIHQARKHKGQSIVAKNFMALFSGHDPILESHKDCGRVQDPYSFRCIPQVHGASRDALAHVEQIIDIELNSVTDNPLVFLDGDLISGGNFHGQPLAMAYDYLAIAAAEIGSISERRIEKLTNPHQSGLPAFLMRESGLQSGYMIPHVVAAALVSENKVLCHPASIDSIPTSADKEDHVSMGPIAVRKARQVIDHVAQILAIELLAACQAIDLLDGLMPGNALTAVYKAIRAHCGPMTTDRSLHKELIWVKEWILSGEIEELLASHNVSIQ